MNGEQSTMNVFYVIRYFLFALLCLFVIYGGGCATVPKNENTLAVVDGEPITKKDLEYSLEITHRREDLSSAAALNIAEYMDKIINDRLIIQEARQMGMEQYPEMQRAIQAYVLRQSLARLYNEEITRKLSLTEKDITGYYKKNYERFSLAIIDTDSRAEADKISEQLQRGDDFEKFARKSFTHSPEKKGGEIVLTRKTMNPVLLKAVSGLKPGGFSGVLKIRGKYYIVKLTGREDADDKGLEKVRTKIEEAVRKEKEKERRDGYLKYLKERTSINIDRELLSAIESGTDSGEREKLLKDKRILVRVHDSALTVGDFTAKAGAAQADPEKIINDWVNIKLLDHEALGRNYDSEPDFRSNLNRYKDQLMKQLFIRRVIIPGIEVSDKILEEYYLSHQKDFLKTARFKIQQITVKTLKEAENVLNALQNKADFSWLAKRKSTDPYAAKGGAREWLVKKHLPEPAKKLIDTLQPGDISPVLKSGSFYMIIRLQDRSREEVEEFEHAKAAVLKAYSADKYNQLYDSYVRRLKESAHIKIYDDAVRAFEESLKR